MGKHSAIRAWGSFLSGLVTIGTLALNIVGVTNIEWQWVALASFVVFCGFAGWTIYGLQQRIQQLESAMPSIEVKVANDIDAFYLDVKNVGEVGDFQAQVEIVSGAENLRGDRRLYSGYWVIAAKGTSHITRDQIDRVKIASLVPAVSPLSIMNFRLYFYDEASNSEKSVDSTSWNPIDVRTLRPSFDLRVTLSADQGLKEGSFIKKYKLSVNGLEELSQDISMT